MDEKDKFLKELALLSKKYRIYIGGCGCCGSPYGLGEDGEVFSKLEYDFEKEKYITDEF